MKKLVLLLFGGLLVLVGAALLYFLVEGFKDGALTLKSSKIELQSEPVVFWILASLYVFTVIGNFVLGVMLVKEVLQKRRE
jgi:hypothetical protein